MFEEISVVVDDTFDVANAGNPSVIAHTHPATDINDSSAAGRSVLTAADAAAQRAALGLDTTVNQTVTASGVSAVARSVDAKLKDIVSVKDFGAVGNGVADDTTAIQAAVNASSGKVLFFPAGTYVVSSIITLISNVRLLGENGMSVIKLASQSWASSNGLMFAVVSITDVQLDSLVFDGNKGNVGTSRSPIIVTFAAQRVLFSSCTFRSCEGICLNISTDADDFRIEGCRFISCGGNPNNSDGYRKQAIAFSAGASGERSRNILVTECYFYQQGLDCISLSACDNVIISNNIAVDGYSLAYNTPATAASYNVTIQGNVVRTCSEFGAGTSVRPAAIDIPNVIGLTIVGNSLYEIDACGIGVFDASENVVVSGNTVVNPMRGGGSAFVSGITIGSGAINVTVEGNLIVDTAGTPLMAYGIVVGNAATNVVLQDNVVRNPLTSRYGYYTTAATSTYTFSFTSSTQVSASTRIVDLDIGNNEETVYGRLSLQGAMRFIPQTTPSSPLAGNVYYDSGTNKLRCYNGTTWNDLF